MKDMIKKYSVKDLTGQKLDTSDRMREFCYELMKDDRSESAHILFLDHTYSFIGEAPVTRTGKDNADFDMRMIVTRAIRTQCANVVLAHSHPGGVVLPSAQDVAATRRAAVSLENIGIKLIDHIIVNSTETFSMRAGQFLPDIWAGE